jgi:hypothetical protein
MDGSLEVGVTDRTKVRKLKKEKKTEERKWGKKTGGMKRKSAASSRSWKRQP